MDVSGMEALHCSQPQVPLAQRLRHTQPEALACEYIQLRARQCVPNSPQVTHLLHWIAQWKSLFHLFAYQIACEWQCQWESVMVTLVLRPHEQGGEFVAMLRMENPLSLFQALEGGEWDEFQTTADEIQVKAQYAQSEDPVLLLVRMLCYVAETVGSEMLVMEGTLFLFLDAPQDGQMETVHLSTAINDSPAAVLHEVLQEVRAWGSHEAKQWSAEERAAFWIQFEQFEDKYQQVRKVRNEEQLAVAQRWEQEQDHNTSRQLLFDDDEDDEPNTSRQLAFDDLSDDEEEHAKAEADLLYHRWILWPTQDRLLHLCLGLQRLELDQCKIKTDLETFEDMDEKSIANDPAVVLAFLHEDEVGIRSWQPVCHHCLPLSYYKGILKTWCPRCPYCRKSHPWLEQYPHQPKISEMIGLDTSLNQALADKDPIAIYNNYSWRCIECVYIDEPEVLLEALDWLIAFAQRVIADPQHGAFLSTPIEDVWLFIQPFCSDAAIIAFRERKVHILHRLVAWQTAQGFPTRWIFDVTNGMFPAMMKYALGVLDWDHFDELLALPYWKTETIETALEMLWQTWIQYHEQLPAFLDRFERLTSLAETTSQPSVGKRQTPELVAWITDHAPALLPRWQQLRWAKTF